MRDRFLRVAGTVVMIAAGLAFAPGAPLLATTPLAAGQEGTSVTMPGGAVLTIWEARTRFRKDTGEEGSWSLAFAMNDGAATLQGTIAPTEDAAPDRSPRLTVDRRTGAPVVFWSRWDGINYRIAYARFQGGVWTDFHYVSYSGGDDLEPRVATTRIGSFLFWISGERYLYAPVELGGGRLLAAPRALRLPGTSGGQEAGTKVATAGSSRRPLDPGPNLRDPGSKIYDGGQDGPIHGNKGKASVWGVGSDPDCRRVVLVVSGADGSHLLIYRFVNGATSLIRAVDLPPTAQADFADHAAASALAGFCD